MSKILVVLMSVLAIGTVACASPNPAPVKQGSPPVAGKLQAPVEVVGSVGSGSASVTLAFARAGTGVKVDVHGTNGLRVTSASPLPGSDVGAGQTVAINVAFDAPAGESNLAVIVSGVFDGVRSAKAVSFTVGQATPSQVMKASAGVKAEPDGDKVKELPAQVK